MMKMDGFRSSMVLMFLMGLILPGKGYNIAIAEGSGWSEDSGGLNEGPICSARTNSTAHDYEEGLSYTFTCFPECTDASLDREWYTDGSRLPEAPCTIENCEDAPFTISEDKTTLTIRRRGTGKYECKVKNKQSGEVVMEADHLIRTPPAPETTHIPTTVPTPPPTTTILQTTTKKTTIPPPITTRKATTKRTTIPPLITTRKATPKIPKTGNRMDMLTSCELKGKYLEGTLPGNRMPTFVSASDAYEACKREQGCSGLTFTPRIGKWTLRSSNTTKKSRTGEISMVKDCMDVHGLPRYTIEGKRHCYAAMKKHFAKFEDAEKSCDESKSCAGIWDDKCNGEGFWTCANLKDWDEISAPKKPSCIHRKKNPVTAESWNTQQNLGDVMLGDQPPEERLGSENEIDLDKEVENSCVPKCKTCIPMVDIATEHWCLKTCNRQPSDCPSHICKCS